MEFWHRSELHALIPGQPNRERIDRLAQLFKEGVHDRGVNKRELETGATLTVEAERSGHDLSHCYVEISVRHDQGRVFGIQAQDAAKPMRPGMLPFPHTLPPAPTPQHTAFHFPPFLYPLLNPSS